jgi:hypothetical protein
MMTHVISWWVVAERDLQQLPPALPADKQILEKLALFLKDITIAWEKASQEARNSLAT